MIMMVSPEKMRLPLVKPLSPAMLPNAHLIAIGGAFEALSPQSNF